MKKKKIKDLISKQHQIFFLKIKIIIMKIKKIVKIQITIKVQKYQIQKKKNKKNLI